MNISHLIRNGQIIDVITMSLGNIQIIFMPNFGEIICESKLKVQT